MNGKWVSFFLGHPVWPTITIHCKKVFIFKFLRKQTAKFHSQSHCRNMIEWYDNIKIVYPAPNKVSRMFNYRLEISIMET